MQVVTERLPNAVAKISVTVDQTEVTQAMDRAFKRVVTKYNVPGFRRGKVPRPIFERLVGVGVIWEAAAKELVDVRYPVALKMAGVEPLTQPQIDIESQGIEPDEPFRFVIAVETKPEIIPHRPFWAHAAHSAFAISRTWLGQRVPRNDWPNRTRHPGSKMLAAISTFGRVSESNPKALRSFYATRDFYEREHLDPTDLCLDLIHAFPNAFFEKHGRKFFKHHLLTNPSKA